MERGPPTANRDGEPASSASELPKQCRAIRANFFRKLVRVEGFLNQIPNALFVGHGGHVAVSDRRAGRRSIGIRDHREGQAMAASHSASQ